MPVTSTTLTGMTQHARRKKARSSPPRRTNPERSAQMRLRLIEATIELLFDSGYAATTTIAVADHAGVSRGAMLHHFPSRVDLLLGTAEHIILEQRRYRAERLSSIENNWNRFVAAADVSWEVHKQPATIALLEILMAARSDRVLSKRIAPLLREMAALRAESAARLATALGITEVKPLEDLILFHLASSHGLAISLMFTQDPEDVEKARELLIHYEQNFAQGLMSGKTQEKAADASPRKRQGKDEKEHSG